MSDRIEAALPADRWPFMKEVVASHPSGKLGFCIMAELEEGGTRLTLYVRDSRGGAEWEIDNRPALAALCLYGTPQGFTQEDVEKLRDMDPRHADWHYLDQLADRIAALLPPPSTETRPDE